MVIVSIDEAQKDLRKIIAQAKAGEEVIITEGGVAVGKLGSVAPRAKRREPGWGKGVFPEGLDLDAPLPDDIREALGG
jgi:antitoxin (DNA-binding transcriptional repressor) of toxin-antitoxin stability system